MDTASRPQLLESGIRMITIDQYRTPILLSYRAGADPRAAGCTFGGPAGRTYSDANGVLQQADANVPRFAHCIGGVLTWLLEGQSQNLMPRANPTKAHLSSGAGTVEDGVLDSYGYTHSIHVPGVAANANAYQNHGTLTGGTTYTLAYDLIMDDGSAPAPNVDFRFVCESVSLWAGALVRRIANTPVYRCSVQRTATGAGPSGGIIRPAGLSGKGVHVVGWQLEALPFPSSLIRSAGSPTTRAAETAAWASTWPSQQTTRYWKYYNLVTAAWVEAIDVATRTGPDDFGAAPQLNRAYHAIKYARGSHSLAEMQVL